MNIIFTVSLNSIFVIFISVFSIDLECIFLTITQQYIEKIHNLDGIIFLMNFNFDCLK